MTDGPEDYNQGLYIAFTDYKRASNSAEIATIMEELRSQVLQKVYVDILENIYKDPTASWFFSRKAVKYRLRKEFGLIVRGHNLCNFVHCMLRSLRAIRLGKKWGPMANVSSTCGFQRWRRGRGCCLLQANLALQKLRQLLRLNVTYQPQYGPEHIAV